jgi:hypothetical protein
MLDGTVIASLPGLSTVDPTPVTIMRSMKLRMQKSFDPFFRSDTMAIFAAPPSRWMIQCLRH